MKILGASYMVYLIIKPFIPGPKKEIKNQSGSLIKGAVLQLINPKLMIFGMTVMSVFILPHYREIHIIVLFSLMIAFVAFIATLTWALFGTLFSKLFNKHGTLLNIIMGIFLLYCIISLFL